MSIRVVLAVAAAAVVLLQVHRGCAGAREAQAELDRSKVLRDSAVARELRVRDSAQQATAERDAAWGIYVRDLRSKHQSELQDAVRASARRAQSEVSSRLGVVFQLEAPDTGSGRPPCEVTLTCSEAAAWQASDSLLRFQHDSLRAVEHVAAAACSTRVSSAVVHQDSIHASRSFQQAPASRGVSWGLAGALATFLAMWLWGAW